MRGDFPADLDFFFVRYSPRRFGEFRAAGNDFTDIEITEDRSFEVWGVISRCVRLL